MTQAEAAITADVSDFLASCIDTVPHLEGLLLLWKSAPQRWTEAEIAARIYVTSEVARRVVHDLAQQHLILKHSDSETGYTFNPHSEAAALLPGLARAYCKNLVAVTRLVHSKR